MYTHNGSDSTNAFVHMFSRTNVYKVLPYVFLGGQQISFAYWFKIESVGEMSS